MTTLKARIELFAGIAALVLFLFPLPAAAAGDGITAAVTIAPQAFLVDRVGAGRVETLVMVPPGSDPHVYEPRPRQLALLSRAAVYFQLGSGIEFENAWMGRFVAVNPEMKICDLSRSIELLPSSGCHTGSGPDPHYWLSPRKAARMAENIAICLARLDPGSAELYRENARALAAELSALHEEISELLAPHRGRAFLVFHPAWSYFAAEYGLVELAIEDEGKEPSARRLKELIDEARRREISTIFIAPAFPAASAAAIGDEISARLVELDPLSGDYLSNLRKAADRLDEDFRR